MHILVSNDDGIYAPGIRALAEAMLPLGKVTLIAPEENQSASGHKKTLHSPLRIRPVPDYLPNVQAFAVNGSPSDCAAVALLGFIKEPIDVVVSGINRGGNVGQDVTYSGTVSVALEATITGIRRAVAFSLDNRSPEADYSHCQPAARKIVEMLIKHELPPLTILNVNFPDGPIKGWKTTRQGMRQYHDQLVIREDPHGLPYYWIGGPRPTGDVNQVDTDLWALHHGYASLTPIHLDLTAHAYLDTIAQWELEF